MHINLTSMIPTMKQSCADYASSRKVTAMARLILS